MTLAAGWRGYLESFWQFFTATSFHTMKMFICGKPLMVTIIFYLCFVIYFQRMQNKKIKDESRIDKYRNRILGDITRQN